MTRIDTPQSWTKLWPPLYYPAYVDYFEKQVLAPAPSVGGVHKHVIKVHTAPNNGSKITVCLLDPLFLQVVQGRFP